MLVNDGVIIIKLWFHMTKESVVNQLKNDAEFRQVSPQTDAYLKQYETFLPISEQVLLKTEQSDLPWHIIEANDKYYRDACAGEIILETLTRYLDKSKTEQNGSKPSINPI